MTAERERALGVVEVFGPTMQGEGPLVGRLCHFIRLGGCDFSCVWCDTPYSWDHPVLRRMTVEDLLCEVARLGPAPWVTISGGNPLLWECGPLVDGLHRQGYRVSVETQGSIVRPWLAAADLVVVSPKPPSAGMDGRWTWDTLGTFMAATRREGAALKVVVQDERDYLFAREVYGRFPGVPFYLQDGRQPGTQSVESLASHYRWLVERAMRDPWGAEMAVLPQLHVWLWGNARGK